MSRIGLTKRILRKPPRTPSCSKHGPYKGPYCPKCFEQVMGGNETEKAQS